MACDAGLRNMIANPAYRLAKPRRVRGRFPVCLSLAQIRESTMRVRAFHFTGNVAAQSVDLENQSLEPLRLLRKYRARQIECRPFPCNIRRWRF